MKNNRFKQYRFTKTKNDSASPESKFRIFELTIAFFALIIALYAVFETRKQTNISEHSLRITDSSVALAKEQFLFSKANSLSTDSLTKYSISIAEYSTQLAKEMRDLNEWNIKLDQNNFEEDHRPRLVITGITFERVDTTGITAVVSLLNIGKSNAYNINLVSYYFESYTAEDTSYNIGDYESYVTDLHTLNPGEGLKNRHLWNFPTTGNNVRDINEKKIFLYAYKCLYYTDAYNKNYFSEKCVVYNVDDPKNNSMGHKYNNAW